MSGVTFPATYPACLDLGIALWNQGDTADAAAAFRRAIEIKPGSPTAYANLGLVLSELLQFDEAIDALRRAVEIGPTSHHACMNLGVVLREQGRLEQAVAYFRRALELKPTYERAHANLIYTLSFGQLVSHTEILAAAHDFERLVCGDPPLRSFGTIPTRTKVRVGFISAEAGNHAVAYFLESYLRDRDSDRFDLTLYVTLERHERKTSDIYRLFDRVRSLVGVDDDAAAQVIDADGIDILIDTTAYMTGSRLRLLSRRCAPIQCHYIGFHGSTGLRAINYFIGDDEITPPNFSIHFSETLIRLPRLWVAFSAPTDVPPIRQISANEVTFGCFNNLAKVRDECLSLWADALTAVPNARLLLKDKMCADPFTRARISNSLMARGVAPTRLEFVDRTPSWRDHMDIYNRVDIALDTSPLNSGTTGFDALLMGVPLISIRGEWMGARMTSAMLKALGRADLIARNSHEWPMLVAETVAATATGKNSKSEMRARFLRSPLTDGASLARALEDAFENMVREHNAGV